MMIAFYLPRALAGDRLVPAIIGNREIVAGRSSIAAAHLQVGIATPDADKEQIAARRYAGHVLGRDGSVIRDAVAGSN